MSSSFKQQFFMQGDFISTVSIFSDLGMFTNLKINCYRLKGFDPAAHANVAANTREY